MYIRKKCQICFFTIVMRYSEKIEKSPFYEIVCILDDFALYDYLVRSGQSSLVREGSQKPKLLPHEECILKIKKSLNGIASAISYMQLSVLHIQRRYNKKYFSDFGFKEYDVYRYYYYVFCHGIATLHDIFFKLIVELCDLNINSKRMIQWDELKKALIENKEKVIIVLMEDFYCTIKEHEKNRNTVSHEGLLASPLLDNYCSTLVWTAHHSTNIDSRYLKYIEGTRENINLLRGTKRKFVATLENLITEAVNYSISLFEELMPKLISKMDSTFLESHKQHLTELNKESVNKYVLTKH